TAGGVDSWPDRLGNESPAEFADIHEAPVLAARSGRRGGDVVYASGDPVDRLAARCGGNGYDWRVRSRTPGHRDRAVPRRPLERPRNGGVAQPPPRRAALPIFRVLSTTHCDDVRADGACISYSCGGSAPRRYRTK